MNIIDAILTLIKRNNFDLVENDSAKDAKHNDFKNYVKNIFSDSFHLKNNISELKRSWYETFSFIGSQVETPDLMLRNGDAVEVKTILLRQNDTEESIPAKNILLSNVPPMKFLYQNAPLISDNCRYFMHRENIFRKDIIYVVGVVKEKRLCCLSMVYGRDYCAANDYYNKIRKDIKKLYEKEKKIIHDNLETKKELARIMNFDPLGLTQVRLNANWYIANPWKAFNDIYQLSTNATFDFFCIINWEKWATLGNTDELLWFSQRFPQLKILPVKIKNPDNTDELRNAVLITYRI